MAGTFDISTINVISPNGLVTKSLTVDNYGYAKIGDERVGVTPTNWIINGMFDVWQRGTSQISSGYASDDRWFNTNTGSSKTHSQQAFTIGQTDVPNNPTYFSRTVVTSVAGSGNRVIKFQAIEDVTKLAGKTVTLSFWAKADSNKNMSIEFWQNFGGGVEVLGQGVQKFSLTTSWQRFTKTVSLESSAGKTIVANNYTGVMLWFDAGSNFNARTDSLGNQSGTFDIANVCLVEGSVPVECPNEPYAEVLRKCQRYYYKINSADSSGDYLRYGLLQCVTTTVTDCMINCPVTMRTYPTSIEYSGSFVIYTAINHIAVTSILLATDGSHQNVLLLAAFVASGLTPGYSGALMSNVNKTSYLAFSAEL